MLKKLSATFLALIFVLNMGSLGVASELGGDSTWELEANRTTSLLTKYSNVIEEIESAYNVVIDKLNDKTMPYIHKMISECNDSLKYDAQELSQAISCELAQQSALANTATVYTNDEVIKDLETKILVSSKMLSGQVRASAATGSSKAKTYTYSIGFSGSFNVLNYGTISFNVSALTSETYTLTGPADGTKLYNGMTADVRYACGILYGDVTRTTWKIVNRYTGEVISTHEEITIPQSSRYINDTTCLGAYGAGAELYTNSGRSNVRTTGHWSDYSTFASTVATNPEQYLSGIGDLG